jgi:diguanylate cyclase (GGDEF)-like protein
METKDKIKLLEDENKRLKKLLNIKEKEDSHYSIEDLVDLDRLNDIFSKFSNITGFTTGFVDQHSREVLISTGWTDICKTYHRGSESSAYICQQSNKELTKDLNSPNKIKFQKCQHGMVDGATPIIIDGKHLANLFSGQVLLNQPNIENFKLNSKEFGYDTDGYLKALEEVKIVSEENLKEVLTFLSSIAQIIADLGKDRLEYLKLNESLESLVKERTKELEDLNRKLKIYASTDSLTNLYNRYKLEKEINISHEEFKRYDKIYSLILVDIDNFKLINDNYGHQVGDLVLQEMSKIFESFSRKTDIIGRWGGEEFLILCKNTNEHGAYNLAQALRNKIQNYKFESINKVTASFGIAQIEDNIQIDKIIKNVDDALYQAKNSGRNKSVKFSDII